MEEVSSSRGGGEIEGRRDRGGHGDILMPRGQTGQRAARQRDRGTEGQRFRWDRRTSRQRNRKTERQGARGIECGRKKMLSRMLFD